MRIMELLSPRGKVTRIPYEAPRDLPPEERPERDDRARDEPLVIDAESGEERHDFADYLVRTKRITAQIRRMALMEQKSTGVLIGTILVRNQFLRSSDLSKAILEFRPERISAERVAASRVPTEVLREKKIVISAISADTIHVSSLLEEGEVLPILRTYYPEKAIKFVGFMPEMLDDFLMSISSSSGVLSNRESDPDEMFHRIMMLAIESGASDIHLEPRPDTYVVFLRKLGVRDAVYEGAKEEYTTILTKIKDRARMDIAQTRKPQDGAFAIEYGSKKVDMRVSTVIGVQGEKAVLRLLDPDRVDPNLDTLGITRIAEWRRASGASSGIAFVCGVTGSGKSTTMDATAKEQDRFGKAIYTIEDPVEFTKAYVTSINVVPEQGQDFETIIKHLMRADPDNIQIGEVRDKHVARQAITAADTGHMILATMHTDSIVSVPSRLMRLGIEPHEIRLLLRGVLVQKLVRTICPTCKGHGSVEGNQCPNKVCGGEGYAGLTVVSECASFTSQEQVDDLISVMSPDGKKASDMPWPKLLDDALDKMEAGITTLDELERVFGTDLETRMNARGIDGRKHRLPRLAAEEAAAEASPIH